MSKITCIHCGDDCGKYPIIWEEKSFCCDGCKTVYQIINKHKLYDYYNFESHPGIKVTSESYQNKFSYLDLEDVKNKLYEFSEKNIKKVTLFIPSIHCSSCIWLLENLHKLHSGITHSLVHFVKKEVTITFNSDEISLRQVVELLVSIHYIPNITLESVEKTKNQKGNKQLLYKIGVAGFAFGNTMLFSFPEYIPGSETIDFSYKSFFGILNLILAIPVFFYSGNDYLISAWKNIRKGILNIDFPIAIGLIAIFIESTFEIITNAGSGYMDSLCGLVFFLLIGKWYQAKTYQALSFDRNYRSYFPVAVTKLKDDNEITVQLHDLTEGDTIRIRNLELIPADSVLISVSANIDYSFVTGESVPVNKVKGEFIYAGGKQVGSTIELLVKASTQQSRLTQLWNQEHMQKPDKEATSLTKLIDVISKRFTLVVLLIGFITALVWFFVDSSMIIKAFTSVLIVACPCALALSIPFTYGNVMRIFGNKGFYLKNNEVLERMYDIDNIVFDKTGTITQADLHDISFFAESLVTNIEMLEIASLARHSTHPLSQSVFLYLKREHCYENFEEALFFNEISGKGIEGTVNGKKIKFGSDVFVTGKIIMCNDFESNVHVSIDDRYIGRFILNSKLRHNLGIVLENLRTNGYDLHLISGDTLKDNELLKKYFDKNLFFNQSPEDKLNYIKNLQQKGKKVLMVGDGLNDAGALMQSNVGISIADNVYHFSPACDAILRADSFDCISTFISFSKTTRTIIKFSFVFSFAYNSVGLYFAVLGLLSPIVAAILMPLSSITVIGFVTLFSSLFANKALKKFN